MILRELFARLGLDVDAQSFAKGQLAVEVVKKGLGLLVDKAVEAVDAFKDNIKETLEYGDATKKAAESIGVGADALQELGHAAKLSGLSTEEMAGFLGILTRNMRAAKDGGEEQAKVFAKAGIAYKDSSGKLRGADEVMADVAAHFATLPKGAEKTALAMQLFGRSGARMIPMLNEGADGLANMRQEARELGLVMGGDALKASEEINDNIDRLGAVTKGLWRGAIAPLLPAINDLVKQFLEWRKANAEIMRQRLQTVLGVLVKVVRGVGKAFAFVIDVLDGLVGGFKVAVGWLWDFAKNNKAVTGAIIAAILAYEAVVHWAAIKTAASWMLSMAPLIAIGAAIGAVLLLLNSWKRYKAGKDSIFGDWMKALDEWVKPTKDEPWWLTAIKDFVRLIRQAIDLMDELTGDAGRKHAEKMAQLNPKEMQARIDQQNLKVARQRVASGLDLTDVEKATLKRMGVSEQAFRDKYKAQPAAPTADTMSLAPEVPTYTPSVSTPAASGGSQVSQSNNLTFNISGGNPEDTRRVIGEVLDERGVVDRGHLEAAAAASGG